MSKIIDAANFYIALAESQGRENESDLMTNLRLQKLLYLTQGWSMARFGKPIFDSAFRAWKYGPVSPDVYEIYKDYGRKGIDGVSMPGRECFSDDEYDLLFDVYNAYSDMSTSALVRMTHEKDSPWALCQINDEIPIDIMRDYFSKLPPIETMDDILNGYPIEAAT